MFGTNALHSIDDRADALNVSTIFPTIQGEGPFAGTPAVFVRLQHCNLKCWYCDTAFEAGKLLTNHAIELEIRRIVCRETFNADLVVITGGEPMRQNITSLVRHLLDLSYRVQIETAGTLWQSDMNDLVGHTGLTFVCSPKTPKINPAIEIVCRDYKYVVAWDDCSDEDGLPIHSTQTKGLIAPVYRCSQRSRRYVQPRAMYHDDGTRDEVETKRNVDHAARIAMRFNYKLSLQQHNIIGLP